MPRHPKHIMLAIVLAGLPGLAGASDELMDLSLEELADIQVLSVSRKAQRLSDTAAAVTVLTREDIRRSGARSVPEALRLVPGVQVAQIGAGRWAVSVRGFNSRFASKLLVQVDGRSVYSPMFSGVFWNALNLMMEDVDRIEVVRGPGASLWGANAVNGVINIVTRNAASTTGSMVRASVDDRGNPEVAVRQGLTLTGGAALRVYALSENRAPFETRGGASSRDEQTGWRTGFRLDSDVRAPDRWTISGDAYRQRSPEVLDLGPLGDNYTPFQFEGAHVLAQRDWTTSVGLASLRAYFDYADVGLGVLAGATVHTGDLDFQHRLPISGAHEWIWGIGLRDQSISVESRVPVISFDKSETHQQTFSAFVQDEIVLLPRQLRLTLGARFEARNMGSPEFQPTVRLLWSPSDRDTLWTHWSRAARTPSFGERHAGLAVGVQAFPPFSAATLISVPNEDLRSESVNAFELGYRRQLDRGSVEFVLFRQRYSHLLGNSFGGLRMPGLIPLTPDVLLARHNRGSAVTEGAELGAEMAVSQDLRLGLAYTVMRQDYDTTGDAILDGGNATVANRNANHWLSLQARIDLSGQQELDLQVRHVAALKGQTAPGVDAYTVVDARYGYRFSQRAELTLSITNLFDKRYSAYSSDYFPSAYAYDRRRLLLTGRWTF
ncbi:MAG: TonB-dependent receptor [Denitromonas halophila]|nr:MAG: TonB-dependent receptor [Denitromonas halophila]TVT74548.1 MAG: TonB-dependent receptor [Denitromonas halophila]TVT75118.1 MAG: TonB-dependent receptor [Denitromonas halophila]